MEVDRRAFLASLGSVALVESMDSEAKAEALEHYMMDKLDEAVAGEQVAPAPPEATIRRGAGSLFGPQGPAGDRKMATLAPMPEKPTLVDFFNLRFAPANHVLQSATRALKTGMTEEIILACLLHDVVLNLVKVDHGWWGAQMLEPYVPEKVSWAIRYHQALRFYPDPSVGYEYPEQYVRIFGKDYEPQPHIKAAYDYARNHKWYMEARLITVNDLYAFDPNAKPSLDPFIDIIGRHFKQPKEGLGNDGSPTAHMWRTMMFPDNPL
jgi:predicted HD phosphohydrolase